MKKKIASPSRQKGQSLVEFAISLTFMLILLAGAVYFGIGLFHYVAMRDAAQEGALYGSMNPTAVGDIIDRVEKASGESGLIYKISHPDPGDPVMTTTVTYTGAACEGNGITVTLQYDFSLNWLPIGAFIEPFLGRDFIRLRASVTDTILTPPCP